MLHWSQRIQSLSKGLVLFYSLCLIALAWFLDTQNPRRTVWQQNQYHSSSYHSSKTKDPYQSPQEGDFKTIPLPFPFFVHIPSNHKQIQLRFLYRCRSTCSQLWLTAETKPDKIPLEIVLQHRIFEQYPMPYIQNPVSTLYQHPLRFSSLEKFIENPPQLSIADPALIQLFQLPASVLPLSQELYSAPNYILTTYHPPRMVNDWFEFDRLVYLDDLLKTQDDYIFHLTTREASGSPTLQLDMTKPVVREALL